MFALIRNVSWHTKNLIRVGWREDGYGGHIFAIHFTLDKAENGYDAAVEKNAKGGIDLTPANMNLVTNSGFGGIGGSNFILIRHSLQSFKMYRALFGDHQYPTP